MACFVQIFTYTIFYSKIKDKKKYKNNNISLPTYPETEEYIGNRVIFSRPNYIKAGDVVKECTLSPLLD